MKKSMQRLAVIGFGVGSSAAAAIYFSHSEPRANAERKTGVRDVPHVDVKWIRYSPAFA